jgi:hypothetical protein
VSGLTACHPQETGATALDALIVAGGSPPRRGIDAAS